VAPTAISPKNETVDFIGTTLKWRAVQALRLIMHFHAASQWADCKKAMIFEKRGF